MAAGDGSTAAAAIKTHGVTEQTYCRWPRQYGQLGAEQFKPLKEREKENARLKRLLADAQLDKGILKEAQEGKW